MNNIHRKTAIDKVVNSLLFLVAVTCAMVIIFITIFVFIKGLTPFLKKYEIDGNFYSIDLFEFVVGRTWFIAPNIYGAGYIIIDTMYVTMITLIIAIPISVLTALFISKIAPNWLAKILSGIVELLSSIPSVIYGLFGIGIVTIVVNKLADFLNIFTRLFGFTIQTAGGLSVLTASLVLAIMIIPTITMISVTSLNAVKKDQELGSLALGVSKTQTYFKVDLLAAKSGIFSGIILGIGRALGEATAVSMVCGNAGSGPTFNPFDITRTLTSTMFMGMHETSGMDYDIRFSVGLLLIVIIFVTNIGLNLLKNRIGKNNG